MSAFWIAFLAVQFAGLIGSAGVDIFHPGTARIICNLVAVVLLEPGLILARAIFDKFYWDRLTTEELFRYASILGFFLNAFFAIWLRAVVRALHPQHNKLRQ